MLAVYKYHYTYIIMLPNRISLKPFLESSMEYGHGLRLWAKWLNILTFQNIAHKKLMNDPVV